ncbi:MAG TPA: 16S rRNA (guanine(966)-N(2))-methyltransferase RsmD [Thermotogota bacterium]|nr:16S rRNA (guanine(966)-N(2))-methyltransferase RsmD [Thermotogota bacterium]
MEKFLINSGYLKMKKIEGVDDKRTRYTPSKVKNSIFSIIASNIDFNGLKFLELCAGSGQIGIEAISRGADKCTFVDISPQAVKTLKKNVLSLDIPDKVTIIKQDVLRFIKKTNEVYDVVFIDTPFIEEIYLKLVTGLLEKREIISDNGIIIVETQNRFREIESHTFDHMSTHLYGTLKIDTYKHKKQLYEEERH